MKFKQIGSRLLRRDSLTVNVIRSCRACGAPGYWHNTPGVNIGCYAPEKVTKLGEDPVGAICPNCNAKREAIEPHGEVWSKEYRTTPWSDAWADIKKILTGILPQRRAGT